IFNILAMSPFLMLVNAVHLLQNHPAVALEMAKEGFFQYESLLLTDPSYILPCLVAGTWAINVAVDFRERIEFGLRATPFYSAAMATSISLAPILMVSMSWNVAMYLCLLTHNVVALMFNLG